MEHINQTATGSNIYQSLGNMNIEKGEPLLDFKKISDVDTAIVQIRSALDQANTDLFKKEMQIGLIQAGFLLVVFCAGACVYYRHATMLFVLIPIFFLGFKVLLKIGRSAALIKEERDAYKTMSKALHEHVVARILEDSD